MTQKPPTKGSNKIFMCIYIHILRMSRVDPANGFRAKFRFLGLRLIGKCYWFSYSLGDLGCCFLTSCGGPLERQSTLNSSTLSGIIGVQIQGPFFGGGRGGGIRITRARAFRDSYCGPPVLWRLPSSSTHVS